MVTDYRLSPQAWPKGQRLTVTVVADRGRRQERGDRVRQVVSPRTNLRSDLTVVLGGSYATHHLLTERAPHPVWAAESSRLHAPLGVNTNPARDRTGGTTSTVRGVRSTRCACPVMEDEALLSGPSGSKFWLAGLGDPPAYRLLPSTFEGVDDLPGTLAHIRTDDPVILLAMSPIFSVRCRRA